MVVIRYLPSAPLPPYTFVPGKTPHPVTDARGHSFGMPHIAPAPLDASHPTGSTEYLRALDLFNNGFFWEAHEAWEGLWVACGRRGVTADFLKGLIKLAAAGVKHYEANSAGVERHARRAMELFRLVRATQSELILFAGLNLDHLLRDAHQVVSEAQAGIEKTTLEVTLVLGLNAEPPVPSAHYGASEPAADKAP